MGRLHPDVLLDIHLSAICSRNQYTREPAAVIDELRAAAGGRDDILAAVAGTWAGYYGDDHTRALAAALSALPGAQPWVAVGRERRARPVHGTGT